MKNKDIILITVAFVSLSIVASILTKHRIEVHHAADPIAGTIIDLQRPLSVTRINVLSGDEFDLTLSDSRRIHGVLDIKTTPEARSRVTEFISKCSNPKVVLKNKHNDIWVIHMYLTTVDANGQKIEINLSKWLTQKKLAYAS